tara:strand:- start:158 stop:502 length:345 start_codon:yes stop_codon:yes gene_type:complete
MKRTALILAGAAVFDLGIVAVSAQARQAAQDAALVPRPIISGPDASRQASSSSEHKGERTIFIKIDNLNTVRACTSRRGEVVTVEGVQQCRLPAPDAPAIGNPTQRPGGIPPRN